MSNATKPAFVPAAVAKVTAAYAGVTLTPPAYDPVAAKALLASFAAHLDALAPAELETPRLDVPAAALAALGAYAFVTQVGPIKQRFEQLATAGEIDLANLEHLRTAAFVALYTHAQAEAEGAFATEATVPPEVIKQAKAVEARMQALCEYKFKSDPEIAPLLALLRPGISHRDLATDLIGYADIYEMRSAEVASDATNYLATDLADARTKAGEILSHLAASMSPKARDTYDQLRRAWTMLYRIYYEVREIGLFLLRYDADRAQRLPTLFTAGGMGRARKTKKQDPGGATPPTK